MPRKLGCIIANVKINSPGPQQAIPELPVRGVAAQTPAIKELALRKLTTLDS